VTASSIPTLQPFDPLGGEVFDLHACIQARFTIKLPEQSQEADQQAA
jgi:hypothetical protein